MNNRVKHTAFAVNDEHLEHHGILGMHWGIRRYQNPDGTLTSAGKKRYNTGDVKNNKEDKKQIYKNKAAELRKEADAISKNSAYEKEYRKWKKNNPDADEDDFGDYLADNKPNLEPNSKAMELYKDARYLDNSMNDNLSGMAMLTALTVAPLSAAIVHKATNSGSAAVITYLGAIGGMTLSQAKDNAKTTAKIKKKYGLP